MSKLVDEEEFYADIVRLSKEKGINQNFDFDNISSVGKDLSKDHEDAGREGTEKVAGNNDSEVATERNLEKDSKEEAVTSTGDSMNGDIKEPAKPDEENTNRDA